jgi:hypothetical protein
MVARSAKASAQPRTAVSAFRNPSPIGVVSASGSYATRAASQEPHRERQQTASCCRSLCGWEGPHVSPQSESGQTVLPRNGNAGQFDWIRAVRLMAVAT